MAKILGLKKLVIFEVSIIIILLTGLSFLGYNTHTTNKIISQQTGLITEQKIKIQGLEGKINELKDKEIEILSKLNILEAKSDISRFEKLCELPGLKITKAEFINNYIKLNIENSNSIKIEKFDFRAFEGGESITTEILEGIEAFKSKEYSIKSEKPDEILIIPSIIVDNQIERCSKEVKTKVLEAVDINGLFNVTASMIVNGKATDINLKVNFNQNGVGVRGSASALKKDGSYGQPFDIMGSVNGRIINLEAKNVELPAGSVEGVNSDLIIEIILEGIVENNDKVVGGDIGDVVLKIKDYPTPGISISVEGVFVAERID